MILSELLNTNKLAQNIADKYISTSHHPTLPLTIYNYTQKAMWDNVWTPETMHCRGLIVEDDTNIIVARGPKKFFNYGQDGAPLLTASSVMDITTKFDGSLGICVEYDGQYFVATRGSFTSEQALHATELFNSDAYSDLRRTTSLLKSRDSWTPIVEILYPENRIVLDYGNLDVLAPLGWVNPEGIIVSRDFNAVRYRNVRLHTALSLPIPDDEEGYVLDILDPATGIPQAHVKLKGDKYKQLHYLMTGVSARKIWQALVAEQPFNFPGIDSSKVISFDELTGNVPDEFAQWVLGIKHDIESQVQSSIWKDATLAAKLSLIPEGRERYEAGSHNPHVGAVLNYIKTGNPTKIHMAAWKDAYPEGNSLPFTTQQENND